MRFWDSSALVPLIVEEPGSDAVRSLYAEDPAITVWWATPVECTSAFCRRERLGDLDSAGLEQALARLEAVRSPWHEITPSERLRQVSRRLLRRHELRAADALQLAAALAAASGAPEALDLVTLDDRLSSAAVREGFTVLGGP